MDVIKDQIDEMVELEKDGKIVFKNLGSFTLSTQQLEFVKKFPYGSKFKFSATPDGRVYPITAYAPYNTKLSNNDFGPIKYDLDRTKVYMQAKLDILGYLFATKPVTDDKDIEFILTSYDKIYKKLMGKQDNTKDSDKDDS